MKTDYQPLSAALEAKLRALIAANPFISFIGIEVPEPGEGYARFVLPFHPQLTNAVGLLQGGVITALADEAVAFALFSLVPDGELISTVELKINFLSPVRQGIVEAVAWIVRRGQTISLGEVEVHNQGKLVAKGLFTYIHLKPQ
ncbi:MAG: PaaI family thioesterase [Desulfobacca sp.]|nr:PaaI family thioesterase [Desulfobacca sp.]